MTIKADFHLHSHFSDDCTTSMEDMILSGIQRGLETMCFTEHHDMNYPHREGNKSPMFFLQVSPYYKELIQLKERYASQINILFGVELGLQPHLISEHTNFINSHPFDFVIGSSHLCNGKDVYFPEFYEGKLEVDAHAEYFQSVLTIVTKFQGFDVYGHLDYLVRYSPTQNTNYSYQKHATVIDSILKTLIHNGKGIEINSGGLKHGLGDTNPCTDIVKRYKELGGEIITIGSDAHFPEYVSYEFDQVASILKSCGFQYYTVFENRKSKFLPL